jgi:hypothetical protein
VWPAQAAATASRTIPSVAGSGRWFAHLPVPWQLAARQRPDFGHRRHSVTLVLSHHDDDVAGNATYSRWDDVIIE